MILVLHAAGYLTERYLFPGGSLYVWSGVAVIDMVFGFKCGQLIQLAYRDRLTELNNREFFHSALAGEIVKLAKTSVAVAVLMIDIDDFKKINDTHGHLAGDLALQQLADIFRENVRGNDAAIRWGGEEFLVILPDTDKDGAYRFAERLRLMVKEHRFRLNGQLFGMTVSIGVASASAATGVDTLIELADNALFRAKQTKDTVVMI